MTAVLVADREQADALATGLETLRLPLAADAQAKLLAYVALLAKWNQTYNLTAIREPGRMLTHHVLDSLAVLPALDALTADGTDAQLVDVGSGAGLPGLPIAIARPRWRVIMLEPVHKKVAFVTQAIAELRVHNAQVHARRVEDHPPVAAHIVISRAFTDLASFAASSARHVAPGGALVAMKGVHPDEELRELPPTCEVQATIPLIVPGVDAARHLIVMRPGPAR